MELNTQQNLCQIELKKLEDELLSRLSAAEGSFLQDAALVEQLEHTKNTAAHIQNKVREYFKALADIGVSLDYQYSENRKLSSNCSIIVRVHRGFNCINCLIVINVLLVSIKANLTFLSSVYCM